eukprot:TRINITY_DN2542_c0_g1_i1.p1 TRINITY_DN2542_c0_g1~~TRINITY_DN2542_c0_g1_i1.p1  ORF type:complete len:106 (-),score=21.17 TRINITY_DN2542_c0_g1_i1:12-329(-)
MNWNCLTEMTSAQSLQRIYATLLSPRHTPARKAKKNGGHIPGESLSKVVSVCISIPEKKWSLLVRRFTPTPVVAFDQFGIAVFINKLFTLDKKKKKKKKKKSTLR